jgi:type VI secretion system VasD/TssJ family lipoprotein
MIRRRSLLLLPALVAPLMLLQCAPAPKPPAVLTLTMIGSADQNPDLAGKPAPVAVRIYQLTATAKFERGDVFALTEHEQQTLGSDDAGSQEFVLSPGETQTKTFELKPMVQPSASSCCTAISTTHNGGPMHPRRPAGRPSCCSTSANLQSR